MDPSWDMIGSGSAGQAVTWVYMLTHSKMAVLSTTAFNMLQSLVGGLEHVEDLSHHIWNFISPIDELHHFSEG